MWGYRSWNSASGSLDHLGATVVNAAHAQRDGRSIFPSLYESGGERSSGHFGDLVRRGCRGGSLRKSMEQLPAEHPLDHRDLAREHLKRNREEGGRQTKAMELHQREHISQVA